MNKKLIYIYFVLFILIFGCKEDSVIEPENLPHEKPSNPFPADGSIDQSIYSQLTWKEVDSYNESLLYSVYFGLSDTLELIQDSIKTNSFDPGILQPNRTYYWKIVAIEGELKSEVDFWQFTTGVAPSNFETVTVQAGEFTYGKSNLPTMIDYDYKAMKYEVSNQQFVNFLNEAYSSGFISVEDNKVTTQYSGDIFWPEGTYSLYDIDATSLGYNIGVISWDGKTFSIATDYKDHPVIYVTWFGANAFAEYYGYRLPNELEWEKLARGSTGFLHPWGNSINGSDANFWNSNDPWERGTTPIGYYNGENLTNDRPSPYGAYDITGNVWEWIDDFWDSVTNYHVVRGGGWNINGTNYYLRSYTRDLALPDASTHYIGFRCLKNE